MYRVLGVYDQLPLDVLQATNNKGEGDQEQMQASTPGEEAVSTSACSFDRGSVVNPPCHSACTSTLSRSSNTKDPRTSPPPLIRVDGDFGEPESDGFEVVDQQSGDQQWATNSFGSAGDDNRVRCLQYRLGSMLEQSEDRRPVVISRVAAPHQCQGATGSLFSTSDLRGQQEGHTCSPEDRQYDSSVLHKSDGWNPLQEANGNHCSGLELELREEDIPVSRTHSGHPERGCRSGITKERRQLRMEARSSNFSTGNADSGSLSGGSFCLQNISSTSSVHELETRSGINSNRCLEPVLDRHKGLCLPSLFTDRQVPFQSTERVKELILIAPVWPTQPWFAVLLSMLFQRPLLLPKQSSLLTNHNDESHPLAHQLSLATWPISGVPSIIKEFQAKQQPLFCLHGERPQRQHTPAAGRDGSSGVPHVDAMLFKRL